MTSPATTADACLFPRARFPKTRYQGSKRKLAHAIVEHVADLDFTTVLDAFGGTGAVAHAFKLAGKEVTYNDNLAFNHEIGTALIENDSATLTADEIGAIGVRRDNLDYPDLVERNFEGIYFTNEENRWLDTAARNIRALDCRFKRSLAWFALFQAAMAKRPYNLFHRKNLYMRMAKVTRSFGNKTSWDRAFDEHFAAFAAEANAAVFDSSGKCRAICRDALEVEPGYDLVYIDTPYINAAGVGVRYRDFYHFLEGLVRYDHWEPMIDHNSKHRRLRPDPDRWADARTCRRSFEELFERFRDSIIVVSYRSDGTPKIPELATMLQTVKRRVRVEQSDRYHYALSKGRLSREVLLIATDT